MQSRLAWLLVGIALVATAISLGRAQPAAPADRQRVAEFQRLHDAMRQTRDPEERVRLGEGALAIEAALTSWPLWIARDRTKALLFFDVAYAYHGRRQGLRADNLEKAIANYHAALSVISPQTFPAFWAETHNNLGAAYADRIRGDRADNLEKAIAQYEATLTVRTRRAFAKEWAQTQDNLGIAFLARVRGERAENIEKAISHYEAALTVRTREALPQNWALTQRHLADAYAERIRGERADNLEKAIDHLQAALTVLRREEAPRDWSNAQNSLAATYLDRIRGERADNLERAIEHLEAALTVSTREDDSEGWARAQNNLANAYLDRIRGERADNLEKAIAHYEAALTVRTREALPARWATTQNNLAVAYSGRIRGEQANNREKAIAHFEAALTVRTRDALPEDWAFTQANLGASYWARVRGDRADNLEKAIACLEAALAVRTREAFPWQWAETRINLATTYLDRIDGERAYNREKAIVHAEAALTVFSRESAPELWAMLQHLLGNAHRSNEHGERGASLRDAIAHYEAALTVYTRDGFPRDHLLTATLLGRAYLEAREWHKAGSTYASAREAFLVLFGQGLQEAGARDVITRAGALFAEAAYAASQRGENELALALASEGRARLIAVSLRMQALDLPAEQRERLDALRASIRTHERAADGLQGSGRVAALEHLIKLRQELLGIVKASGEAARGPAVALAQARALAADGGAVIVPILTKIGAKVVLVTAATEPQSLTVIDLPELTTDTLDILMRGNTRAGTAGGWIAAYNINYLAQDEIDSRWDEWLTAISELGPVLWNRIGSRLAAELRDRGVKPGARIFWMPSGALGILPLGIAQDPVSKRYLADDYEIAYAPSLEALVAAHSQVAKGAAPTLAAVINPTGDLDGTEKEGALVAPHFPESARATLIREAATREAVLAALKGKSYWHIASHGTFSWDDARQSALVMHNRAPLSVGTLLETDGLGRPRLVVLSACETGLYDIDRNPDEFVGLPGAFTALGAAGVLGTLWPVSDAATALLIGRFYELHMGSGLSPPTALARAQAWLRNATSDDLLQYAQAAAARGRLEARHLAEIKRGLSAGSLARLRNRAIVHRIAPDKRSITDDVTTDTRKPLARPYAHPYYWAGFIHTGL